MSAQKETARRRKTCIRIFTITGYEAEEAWLGNMYRKGWKIVKYVPPCFYIFEACEPQAMVFRLEFNEIPIDTEPDYLSMLKDFGWTYLFTAMGWRYYCKPETESRQDNELFTDAESKLTMIQRIFLRRMVPIGVVFAACVLPQSILSLNQSPVFSIFWYLMLALYIYLLIHCGLGLYRLRKKYRKR